jgi:hypothetical protein
MASATLMAAEGGERVCVHHRRDEVCCSLLHTTATSRRGPNKGSQKRQRKGTVGQGCGGGEGERAHRAARLLTRF